MSIEELKQLQLKIIRKNKMCNIIGILTFLVFSGIYIVVKLQGDYEIPLILLPLLFGGVFFIIAMSIIKIFVNGGDISKFTNEYKKIFVLSSLRNNFENIVYFPLKGLSKEFIKNVGMLDTGDRFSSNDYISGRYKNITFEQSDVHIEEEHTSTDSDGNTTTSWVTIFKGRIMIFDFNKRFKANIQVASRYFNVNKLPWSKKFTRVKMEDVDFNKMFNTYAESEHEAFYILTPHFMEKIKNVTRELNCGVMFCFVDNKLHIAINNNQDSFECNPLKPINEQEIEENIMKDIKIITDFVEQLDLDNDLFRREV